MTATFSLRRDRLGLRPVFFLGNLAGRCPFDCLFCSVKASEMTKPTEARRRFEELWSRYEPLIASPYHPLIYNEGNVTNQAEFPQELLDHILEFFRADPRVQYVGVNSREKYATGPFLDRIIRKGLPFPIHFVFGLESASEKGRKLLGKEMRGEFERLANKLATLNHRQASVGADYSFGLDVNLVFLPELYVGEGRGAARGGDFVSEGLERDVSYILKATQDGPPTQINIHPFHRVETLPFSDADLAELVEHLPTVCSTVERRNQERQGPPTYIFVGMEGKGYEGPHWRRQTAEWRATIDEFNATGHVDPRHQLGLSRACCVPGQRW